MKTLNLPSPTPQALLSSQKLQTIIRQAIIEQGGNIPFSQFMQMALYTPRYGYYSGGAHKIGAAGDFITAPSLTPLFGQTLARQIAPLLSQTAGNIYEFGAGTGVLAATLLNELTTQGLKNYYIIEISAELAQRQREHIASYAPLLAEKVIHLSELPDHFDGVLIGNEVLDAMPVELIEQTQNGAFNRIMVSHDEANGFIKTYHPLQQTELIQAAQTYFPQPSDVQANYISELHPTQHAFITTLAQKLQRGAMIWFDYGFDAAQYYHPQRDNGTLIGHYRHHSVHNPFYQIGLTDLTAHINFTDIAQAACDSNLDLIGYSTQATFLFNLGITELLIQHYPDSNSPEYIKAAAAVQMLTAQHEMGELFKVIAFGKNIDPDWQGFIFGDICHKL